MAPSIPVKILLIEDEPSIVRALIRLLHHEGYTVDTADNGQRALAQLHTQPYDLILCDLHMPVLDGVAFYTLLEQQAPTLCQRVIFLTGDTLGAASTAFLAQCGQPCLYKPCTAAGVRCTLQQQLEAVGRATGEAPPEDGTLIHTAVSFASFLSTVFTRREYVGTVLVGVSSIEMMQDCPLHV
jgi:CheY-like chemotaxis protein